MKRRYAQHLMRVYRAGSAASGLIVVLGAAAIGSNPDLLSGLSIYLYPFALMCLGFITGLVESHRGAGSEKNGTQEELPVSSPLPGSSFYLFLSTIIAVCASLVIFIFYPNYMRAMVCGQLTSCKSNLKNMGTALEMYSTDNGGRYPRSLSQLTPAYLSTIPTCASAGKVSYVYTQRTNPDIYTTWCSGRYHTCINNTPNYPQYDSIQGLIEP